MAMTQASIRIGLLILTFGPYLFGQPRKFPHDIGYVPLTDGTKIAYTLYRPSDEGSFPTLLIYNMYDASAISPEFNQTPTGEIRDFLERGYAVMGANTRGTGCSSGVRDPLHAETIGQDGAEVVEWIADQSWSDGAVGMFGHSGSGMTQFFVAAQQPPHLKAIVPGAAPSDLYSELAYPGGLFNYAFMYLWSDHAQPSSSQRAIDVHLEWGDEACEEHIRDRPKSDLYAQLRRHPLKDHWWEERSVYPIASRIRTPTYVIFGWQDQNVDSRAAYVFDDLAGPKKMLLTEASHNVYIKSPAVRREKLRFLDHWVRGVDNGIMEGKPVTVWWSMEGSVESLPSEVRTYDRIPGPETRWTSLHLTPDGGFSSRPYRGPARTLEYLYPMGGAFVYGGDSYPHEPYRVASGLRFLSEPLPESKRILGQTFVELYISSGAGDTSFQVVISELRKDGTRKYLQRGYLNSNLRDPETDLAAPDQVQFAFRRKIPTESNRVTRYVIQTNATGSVLASGSMLELQILAPLVVPEPIGQWGFMPFSIGLNKLHFATGQGPRLVVPVDDD